ncbi:MAG TPA: RsmE family RNA methyltransferase, partial [bacterium]|nr:RsmE family RNA methyltransferase [bacterium]
MKIRVFTDKKISNENEILLSAEETKYLKIMRVKANEKLELFGADNYANAEFLQFNNNLAKLKILDKCLYKKNKTQLTAIQCITEFHKPELIAQKFTELGIDEIVFVESDKSKKINAVKKLRIMRAVIEGIRQCRRYSQPALVFANLKEYLLNIISNSKKNDHNNNIFVLSPDAKFLNLDNIGCYDNVYFIIGPESGFSNDEYAFFKINNFSEFSIN